MASDPFTRANEAVLLTPWGAWLTLATCRLVSNAVRNSSGSDGDSGCRYTSSTVSSSQWKYISGVGDGGPAIHCVSDGVNGADGYFITAYDGNSHLIRADNGGFTQLGADITGGYTANDLLRLRRSGNDIIYSKNGSDVATRTDATYTGTTGNPGGFFYTADLIMDDWTDGVASGQSINVGLASETDTAFAAGKRKSKAVGLTTEADSAFSVAVRKTKAVGLATETDSAFAIGKRKSRSVGLATETDTPLSATVSHFINVGLASETDSAFAVGRRKSKAVGLATETDTAFPVASMGGVDLPTSYYTDFPLTENPIDQDGMFRVGTDTAFYGTPRSTPGKCFAATFVGEIAADFDDCLAHLINHAVPVNHRVTATVFRATSYNPTDTHEVGLYARMVIGAEFVRGYEVLFGADGAFQVVRWEGTDHDIDNFFTGITVSGAGPGTLANGDEIALHVTGSNFEVFKNGVSVATFTDSTFADGNPGFGFFVRPGDTTKESFCLTSWSATSGWMELVGIATETDSAFSVGKRKTKAVGLTDETDTAFAVGKRKTKAVGLNTETDTALTVSPRRSISVGLATETDSVFAVGKRKSRAVGIATESDLAYALTAAGSGGAGGGYSGGHRSRLGLGLGLG